MREPSPDRVARPFWSAADQALVLVNARHAEARPIGRASANLTFSPFSPFFEAVPQEHQMTLVFISIRTIYDTEHPFAA